MASLVNHFRMVKRYKKIKFFYFILYNTYILINCRTVKVLICNNNVVIVLITLSYNHLIEKEYEK